jgi:hypothetical protein
MRLHQFAHKIIGALVYGGPTEAVEPNNRLQFVNTLRAHFDEDGELVDVPPKLLAELYCLDCDEELPYCQKACDVRKVLSPKGDLT